jgi:hypothetical protein
MRKLEKCPACKTRSEKSKSSCLLVSEHIGKYNMVDSSIFDGYDGETHAVQMCHTWTQ